MRQSGFERASPGLPAAPPRYVVLAEPGIGAALRFCPCGCRRKVTHLGCSNGQVVVAGCDLRVRRWVRDGAAVIVRRPASPVAH